MKNIKKLTILFFLIALAFSCSSNDEDDSSGCETCTYTPTASETIGTVADEIIGVHNVVLFYSQNGYVFADGKKAKFTLSKKEMIVEIEGTACLTLKNPVASANLREFTFTDNCRDNLIYSASISNNGGLNEINVGSLNKKFYGQFK